MRNESSVRVPVMPSSSRCARTLVPLAVIIAALAASSHAKAGGASLSVVAVHVASGAMADGAPCRDGAVLQRASRGPGSGLSAYAAARGFCAGGERVSVLEEPAGPGDVFLPTRQTEAGTWVSGTDGARLVRAMSPSLRDLDFQPAEALGTHGPDRVSTSDDGIEPEGFVVTTADPSAAAWFRTATAWVGDPDRVAVAAGASVLATCSALTWTCMVTLPVCADVSIDLEARDVRTPEGLGPELVREYRIARDAFCR